LLLDLFVLRDYNLDNVTLEVFTAVTMKNAVALVRTDVSEGPSISIIRVTRIGELGTTDSCHPDDGSVKFLQNVGSYNSHTA
jgi:hypothetical protein